MSDPGDEARLDEEAEMRNNAVEMNRDENIGTVHNMTQLQVGHSDPLPVPVISDAAWLIGTADWINAHIRNTAVAQVVEAWNHLTGALPHLRKYLEDAIKRNPA